MAARASTASSQSSLAENGGCGPIHLRSQMSQAILTIALPASNRSQHVRNFRWAVCKCSGLWHRQLTPQSHLISKKLRVIGRSVPIKYSCHLIIVSERTVPVSVRVLFDRSLCGVPRSRKDVCGLQKFTSAKCMFEKSKKRCLISMRVRILHAEVKGESTHRRAWNGRGC